MQGRSGRVVLTSDVDATAGERHIRIYRRCHEDLIEPVAQVRDTRPSDVVELAEHVIEQQHRPVTDTGEQRCRPDLAGQRDRPGLTL